MFCPTCGKSIPDGSKFCLACGQAILTPAQPEIEAVPAKNPASRFKVYGVVIFGLLLIAACMRIVNKDFTDPATVTQPPAILDLKANIGRTAYNAANGMEIGVVVGVTTSVVDYADRPDNIVLVYQIRRDDRILRFPPGAVSFK